MNMTTNALIEERTDTKIKFKGVWYEESCLIHDNEIQSPWSHPSVDQMNLAVSYTHLTLPTIYSV